MKHQLGLWSLNMSTIHGNSPTLRPDILYDHLIECPHEITLYYNYYRMFPFNLARIATEFILPSSLYKDFKKGPISITGYELRDNFSLKEYEKALMEMNSPGKSTSEVVEILGMGTTIAYRCLEKLERLPVSAIKGEFNLISCRKERPGQRKGRPSRIWYLTNEQALTSALMVCVMAELNEKCDGGPINSLRKKYSAISPAPG